MVRKDRGSACRIGPSGIGQSDEAAHACRQSLHDEAVGVQWEQSTAPAMDIRH